MKGIVFTEFLEMVEKEFGYDMVDDIIEASDLPSNGVYTAVGTYEFSEITQLLGNLSERTKIDIPTLLNSYGKYLFHTFEKNYTPFFEKQTNAFDFLESIENHIHVEVKKLYPDAQLPTFDSNRIDDKTLELIYRSSRKMSDFAEGLIFKTLIYYKTIGDIKKEFIEEDGSVVKFIITIE